ncbi:MAG: autotransporter outer membrane beta-barrel domain-containing protein, partial [Brevundimonas sp.]
MRILLATAVAIAPLLVASQAAADVVINTSRTTPIRTSTATGTGPDNIEITTNGLVSLTTGTAVRIDSSHNVSLTGTGAINMTNSDSGSTGILVDPGLTTNIRIDGTIAINDSITDYPDTDSDGDIDGPWATGSDRYGIRLAAGGDTTGNVIVGQSGAVTVDGNNSYAISVEGNLIGKLENFGLVRVFGDNSVAIRTLGTVTGPINLLGTVNARGANTIGVSIGGDVTGRLTLQGAIDSSGYRYTTRGTDEFIGKLEPDDLLQGGPAVLIGASVSGGVVVDRPPTDADTANADEDGDGIADANETTATINSYGSAAGIQVGSTAGSITLGVAGTGDNAYGFINRGSVTGQGVYDGITASAVVFGGNAGQTVTIDGGVRNEGTIAALAYDANATGVRFGEGSTTAQFYNGGTLTAGVSSDVAAVGTSLQIDVGANLPSVNNNGNILASTGGGVADVYGIRDLSGTLTSITNTGSIQAVATANADGDAITSQRVAIDVSANTTGVTVLQNGIASTPTSADPDSDGDGVTNSNEPVMIGDVRFGSGSDTLDVRNGYLQGDISFGAGADVLSISGGGLVRGALSDTDGDLSIDVSNGTLETHQTTTLNVSSLNVGADGELIVTIDPAANNSSGGLNVAGAATLATGAGLGVRFNSLLDGPARFDLINAGTLNAGAIDMDSFQENSPYLYVIEGGIDAANNTVYEDVRQRTTDEAGLISVEASMYDAFYSSLSRDADMRAAFLAQLG